MSPVTSLWRSVLRPRAEPFALRRPVATVTEYGQVRTEVRAAGEVWGVLVPLRLRKAMTERFTEALGEALFFTDGEVLVGDLLERSGGRWEVLSVAYWPDQALHVAEVRRAEGA